VKDCCSSKRFRLGKALFFPRERGSSNMRSVRTRSAHQLSFPDHGQSPRLGRGRCGRGRNMGMPSSAGSFGGWSLPGAGGAIPRPNGRRTMFRAPPMLLLPFTEIRMSFPLLDCYNCSNWTDGFVPCTERVQRNPGRFSEQHGAPIDTLNPFLSCKGDHHTGGSYVD
jgi:hypothetical protein